MTSPTTKAAKTTQTQAEILQQLLQTPIHEQQLRSLKDIGTTRTWDFSLPTIGRHRGFTPRHNFNSDESFLEILEKDVGKGLPFKILQHAGVFDQGNKIVLFGGCLLDIILKREDCIKDFDLRLVGEEFMDNEAMCVDTAKSFVASIFDFLTSENKRIEQRQEEAKQNGTLYAGERKYNLTEITVSRVRSTVTVNLPRSIGAVFQLTFAPTRNIPEMLANCQPHCTRIAIQDGAVVLDEMARYSIESTCVILDTASFVNYHIEKEAEENSRDDDNDNTGGRTIASQIMRYIKYFLEKGFDIIVPDLDMEKLPRRNLEYHVCEVLALPSLIVIYDEIKGNIIMTERLELPKYLASKSHNGAPIGEYDAEPTIGVGEAVHFNLRCLVHDVYDSFKYVAQGERYEEVFDFVPSLTPRMVDKSYETVTDSLKTGTIPIQKITGYFSVTPPHEVIEELIARPLKRTCLVQSGKLPQTFVLDDKMLAQLAEKETDSLKVKIQGLRDTMKGKNLDKLVVPYPENVSTVEELYKAFYGEFGVKKAS